MPRLRGRYCIISALGSGGFGRTYLAEDVDKLGERCVVKQFVPRVQGKSALQTATELFEQEARGLQQLGKHPQIPNLYAYFQENNYLYLVQEFVEGENLLQELKQQGAFSELKILTLLQDLLPILQFIHEQQVIHRDIKPENIVRRKSDGKLVLIDFGVAKQATAAAMAGPGTTIGTYGYAPKEQIKEGKAYPASDLYSLGASCFHLLTNISPWSLSQEKGYDWVRIWQQHLRCPISEKLEQILSKLLGIDHEQRYQSVSEVLEIFKPKPPRPNLRTWLIVSLVGGIVAIAAIKLLVPTTQPLPTNYFTRGKESRDWRGLVLIQYCSVKLKTQIQVGWGASAHEEGFPTEATGESRKVQLVSRLQDLAIIEAIFDLRCDLRVHQQRNERHPKGV